MEDYTVSHIDEPFLEIDDVEWFDRLSPRKLESC